MAAPGSLSCDAMTSKRVFSMKFFIFVYSCVFLIRECVISYSFPRGINSVRKSSTHLQMDSSTYIPLLVTTPRAKR